MLTSAVGIVFLILLSVIILVIVSLSSRLSIAFPLELSFCIARKLTSRPKTKSKAMHRRRKMRLVRVEEDGSKPKVMPFKHPVAAILQHFRDFSQLSKRSFDFAEGQKILLNKDFDGSLKLGMMQGSFLAMDAVLVWDLQLTKEILQDKEEVFGKVKFGEITDRLIADSVLSVQGERWRKQRAILSPAFRVQHLRNLLPSIIRIGDDLVARWKPLCSQPVLVSDWMSRSFSPSFLSFPLSRPIDLLIQRKERLRRGRRVTLQIIGKMGFGYDFHALEDETLQSPHMANYKLLFKELGSPIHALPKVARLLGRAQQVSFSPFPLFPFLLFPSLV